MMVKNTFNSLSPKRPHPSHPGQWFIVYSRASPLTNMCVSRQPYCREEKKHDVNSCQNMSILTKYILFDKIIDKHLC